MVSLTLRCAPAALDEADELFDEWILKRKRGERGGTEGVATRCDSAGELEGARSLSAVAFQVHIASMIMIYPCGL